MKWEIINEMRWKIMQIFGVVLICISVISCAVKGNLTGGAVYVSFFGITIYAVGRLGLWLSK